MLIDSYTRYRRDPTKKTKCLLEAYSQAYEPLHRPSKRTGQVVLYVTQVPECIQAHASRKPALTLIGAGSFYLSGVFMPDIERPGVGFGDVQGTEDSLLFIQSDAQVELFVSKGKKTFGFQIFSMFADGDQDLQAEIADHRQKATIQQMPI